MGRGDTRMVVELPTSKSLLASFKGKYILQTCKRGLFDTQYRYAETLPFRPDVDPIGK